MSDQKVGIQYGVFSGTIWGGTLNPAETEFTHKQDVTGMVLRAIGYWVEKSYEGHVSVTLHDGSVLELTHSHPKEGG